jgi:hypothetical protein
VALPQQISQGWLMDGRELEAENTKLKPQVANLEEALTIHSYEGGEDDELEDWIEHDGLL